MRPDGALPTLAILLLIPGCFEEEFETRYASLADARESIDAGWIPRYLPASARDIRERHDIDTNEIWISFRYDPENSKWMEEACERADDLAGPYGSPAWWPEPLTGAVGTGPDRALWICTRAIGGVGKRHIGALAVEPTTGTAWYWEPRR